jgi:hypothetical protein
MVGMEYFYELSSGLPSGGPRYNKSTQNLLLYHPFRLKHDKKMITEYTLKSRIRGL